ncbi:MAG: diphosphate--fructose-6-phosphate 1-phosphotransferase [Vallitalea sp.]|nr:diphosphate--fructose-6-phosphate 1-phosphotransferase [Vallitalea sp.]
MMSNILIVHGGGPTTVLNSSLYGAIKEAQKHEHIQSVYGALGGTAGFLVEDFVDFTKESHEKIELLKSTPGTAIGTSRTPLYEKEYNQMVQILLKNDIKYVIFNGGNGTMDACGNLAKVAKEHDIKVIGIPKTIDNDLAMTDHSPGYGSMARYMATSVAEAGQDVKSMPIHVSIIEAMGRNVGWITAAAALARKEKTDAPHMILLPEVPFDEDKFLDKVKKLHDELGGVVVVASEGLKYENGEPIVKPIFKTERATYFGDVGTHLAELVIKKLGIKARSEKPGIIGRSSISLQSSVDREEAINAGREAVKAAIEGQTGKMVACERESNSPYTIKPILVPIEKVMMHEKSMPKEYIDAENYDVTQEFVEYCKPLIGDEIPEFAYFQRSSDASRKI